MPSNDGSDRLGLSQYDTIGNAIQIAADFQANSGPSDEVHVSALSSFLRTCLLSPTAYDCTVYPIKHELKGLYCCAPETARLIRYSGEGTRLKCTLKLNLVLKHKQIAAQNGSCTCSQTKSTLMKGTVHMPHSLGGPIHMHVCCHWCREMIKKSTAVA